MNGLSSMKESFVVMAILSTHRLMTTVIGRLIRVKTIVKTPIRTPPAGGVEYTPLGPRVDEPPTKMTEAMEMRVTKINMGSEPKPARISCCPRMTLLQNTPVTGTRHCIPL